MKNLSNVIGFLLITTNIISTLGLVRVIIVIDVRGCELVINGIPISRIVEKYGTPLYVYDEDTIVTRISEVLENTRGVVYKIFYSMKANGNPYIVKLVYGRGLGIETVSPGEIYVATRAGVNPSDILFTGSSVSRKDLEFAISMGVNINIDSISALEKLCSLGYRGSIGIRINPMFGAGYHRYTVTGGHRVKFGIPISDVMKAIDVAKRCGIDVVRLHIHMGSGIDRVDLYLKVLEILVDIARKIDSVEELDLGGGFAIPYKPTDRRFPWREFGEKLREKIRGLKADRYRILIEPGRYIIAEAGILITRVTDVKILPNGIHIIGTDTGMNHLIRPALYGAYHEVIVANKLCEKPSIIVDIVGNLCESGDILAYERKLPRVEEGDIIAIMNTGAYGYSMASNYNLRFLPPEVMISQDGRDILIRKAQTYEDLLTYIP